MFIYSLLDSLLPDIALNLLEPNELKLILELTKQRLESIQLEMSDLSQLVKSL